MASIDPNAETTSQIIENLLALSTDVVVSTGTAGSVNADVPTGSIDNAPSIGM